MDHLLYFEDESLQSLIEGMDQMPILRNGAFQHMEEIRNELIADIKWPDTAEEMEDKRRQEIMEKVHMELKANLLLRDQNVFGEAIAKFERNNENKRLVFQEALKREREEALLHRIFVDLVKGIMKRRNPQMAKIMMNKLRQHNVFLSSVHQELIMRVEREIEWRKMRDDMLTEMKKERKEALLHRIFVDLVKRIMKRRNPHMAKIMMNKLRQQNAFMRNVHEELIRKAEEREKMLFVRKIQQELLIRVERMVEMKKRKADVLTEMMKKVEEREKLLFAKTIQKELLMRVEREVEWKKIRDDMLAEMMIRVERDAERKKRRGEMLTEMMRKVEEREKKLFAKNIQQELLMRVEREVGWKKIRNDILTEMMMRVERDAERKKRRDEMFTEMMRKVEEREKMLFAKNIQQELLMRVEKMVELKKMRSDVLTQMMREIQNRLLYNQIRNFGFKDVLNYQLEKPDGDDNFAPRKLFLFGIDSLRILTKDEGEPNEKIEKDFIVACKDHESQYCSASATSMNKANDRTKPHRTLKSRLKKFLGMK